MRDAHMLLIPAAIRLYDGTEATLTRSCADTEDPADGDESPPKGYAFAYYSIGRGVHRVMLGIKQLKFSPSQTAAIVAAHLIKR